MHKTFLLILVLVVVIKVSGQQSVYANISANIVESVGVVNGAEIAFNNVHLYESKGRERLFTGEKINVVAGNISIQGGANADATNATLNVSYAYALSLPASAILLQHTSGNETVTMSGFRLTPTNTSYKNGQQQNAMVATLQLNDMQSAGAYCNKTPFNVIVHFN